MFMKAGAISLALLLASRLLGLVRESAIAASFGGSGLADVAVLVLTLPDWMVGVAVSGALSYVLIPAWGGMSPASTFQLQRRVAHFLSAAGGLAALALVIFRADVIGWIAPGLPDPWRGLALTGLIWSALALPLALLAALWSTRLQQERDFLGYYGANLWVNAALIGFIALAGWSLEADRSLALLGAGLLLAMGLRLAWQRWRMRGCVQTMQRIDFLEPVNMPAASLWMWASLSAGLPLVMPFLARSLASGQGEGGLAAFHYAWKLVELPLTLAIQLVATLALPSVVAAVSQGMNSESSLLPVRKAFALAWTLACMAAAGLVVGADAVAALLFGWGRMDPGTLAHVAELARVAAWGLLPQALSAVALTVLAAQSRLSPAACAYGAAAGVLGVGAAFSIHQGQVLMGMLNGLFAAVALSLVLAIGRDWRACLPLRAMVVPLVALFLVALVSRWLSAWVQGDRAWGLFLALAACALVALTSWPGAQGLRHMLRR